jgi:DNA-binding protein YbaB
MRQYFLRPERSSQDVKHQIGEKDLTSLKLVYEPTIVGAATIRFMDRKRKFEDQIEQMHLAWPEDSPTVNWNDAVLLAIHHDQLEGEPMVLVDDEPYYAPLPGQMADFKTMQRIQKDYSDWLYHTSRLIIQVHPELKLSQKPKEDPSAFGSRVQQAARERRDQDLDELEKKYAKQLEKLEKKLRRLERELAADQEEYSGRKREEAIGAGESVLSFFLGRRRTRAATTIARRRRYTSKAKREIEETQQEIAELKNDIERLEHELKEATEAITEKWDGALNDISEDLLKPRRSDVIVKLVALLWTPIWHVTHRDGATQKDITLPEYTR